MSKWCLSLLLSIAFVLMGASSKLSDGDIIAGTLSILKLTDAGVLQDSEVILERLFNSAGNLRKSTVNSVITMVENSSSWKNGKDAEYVKAASDWLSIVLRSKIAVEVEDCSSLFVR